MDLRDKLDLIGTIRNYLPFGIVAMAGIAVIIVVGYFIYKKILKGKKKISIGKLAWGILFVCYVLMLGSVTLLSRGKSYNGGRYPLFYSYREAWYSFSVQEWRNLILNIWMFVPLGFLLPMGVRKMRRFWKTALCGFAVTVMIEILQHLTQRGVFEWDDVLNNTVGAMIGYGLFVICYAIVVKVKSLRHMADQECNGVHSTGKISGKYVISCQIPLIVTCICYVLIFGIYQHQELGNLQSQLTTLFHRNELMVTTDQTYSKEEQAVPVYQLVQMNREECVAYAADFFEKIGDQLAEDETIHYDNTDVFYGKSGNTLWLDYEGMTWNYTDFDTTYAEDTEEDDDSDTNAGEIKSVTDADEAAVRAALEQYQITIPESCTFSNDGEGNYTFTASELKVGDRMYDGKIECRYYSNGKMSSLSNQMTQCYYYRDMPIISEQEAYEKIAEGRFRVWMFDSDTYDINTGEVSLIYEKDSKGFYQPEYKFHVIMNGSKEALYIPAVK